jgi:uncharacterized protein (UPF0333 family)
MKKFFILFFLSSFAQFVSAQKAENSPYTRYGLGQLNNNTIVGYRGMGNTGIANVDKYHINLVNPAAYGILGTAAFEIGANAKFYTLSESEKGNSATQRGGGLDYIALGFPLKNPLNEIYESKKKKTHFGMGFSLARHSTTNYNIAGRDSISNVGRFNRKYSGNGGTYKFTWGNAMNYKNFSFGADLSYIFGGIETNRDIEFLDLASSFNTYVNRKTHLSGLSINTGMIYLVKLNEKDVKENNAPSKQFIFGLTFNPGSKFKTYKDEYSYNRQQLGATNNEANDTISFVTDLEGKGRFGNQLGFGVTYQSGESTIITAEIKTNKWSSYFNDALGDKENDLNDAYTLALGGYHRPNYKSYTSFWKRAFFKYGAYYAKDPRVVLNKDVNTYGFTFGLGLPYVFQRKISHNDINFDIGKTGSGTAIEETYFKVNFGFTFNDDEWFIKRKYN